jgi:hypothetical protein
MSAEQEVWSELVAASCGTSPPPPVRRSPAPVYVPMGDRIADLEETVAVMQAQMADLRESFELMQRSFIMHGVKMQSSESS